MSLRDTKPEHPFSLDLQTIVAACKVAKGGFKVAPVHLEVYRDRVHLKRSVLPYGLREQVRQQLNKISEVESPAWGTPIVTPLKLDGKTPRIWGDYRQTLNRSLLQQSCATEEPEDVLHNLNGAKVFPKIDLQNAFLQLPLHENSMALTTIKTPFGLFANNFLPFGLSVSPSIFQKTINGIISGIDGVVAYQDDVIVFAMGQITFGPFHPI